MAQRPDARDAFLKMLGNPSANNHYSVQELCKIFGLSESTVREKLRNIEGYVSPKPEVKDGPLPPEDQAFFLGSRRGKS